MRVFLHVVVYTFWVCVKVCGHVPTCLLQNRKESKVVFNISAVHSTQYLSCAEACIDLQCSHHCNHEDIQNFDICLLNANCVIYFIFADIFSEFVLLSVIMKTFQTDWLWLWIVSVQDCDVCPGGQQHAWCCLCAGDWGCWHWVSCL